MPAGLLLVPAGYSGTADNETLAVSEVLQHFPASDGARGGGKGASPVPFEIDASLPELKKHGMMRGFRVITGVGRVVFTQLQYAGDNVVKTALIARFLTAQGQMGIASEDVAISNRNYQFRYRRTTAYNDRTALVFQIVPRGQRLGLLRGELWLDSETALPLREWGEFVRSPSVWVNSICMTRDYILNSSG